MKIALVHDYLQVYGGAERVLEAMHDIWPEAPVYTAFVNWKGLGPHAERIKKWDIRTSWVERNWFVKKFHSPLRFLTPWVWKYFDFSDFDVVITSSAWYMPRGIKTNPKTTKHICYLHTPPRYLYGYDAAKNWHKCFMVYPYKIIKPYSLIVNYFLRLYDFKISQNVDYFIANSIETQRRITKFYRRNSKVIYPPVDIHSRNVKHIPEMYKDLPKNYYLVVSRLARAKHIDLAIEACQKLNKKLVIVGKGQDEDYLKSKVQMSHSLPKESLITFLGEVDDKELPLIYTNAKALIFPAKDEEFGIVPVEAMGYGIPIVALKSGGVPETVIEEKTGVFFDELTVESIISAIKKLEKLKIRQESCIKRAKNFSKQSFKDNLKQLIKTHSRNVNLAHSWNG